MRRRLLLTFAALFVGVLAIVVTVPWWLGAAVRSGGKSRGLTFARYERIGYGRFALEDVEFRRAEVRVTVKRLEMDTPVLWGWRHWRKMDGPVVATNWLVQVERSTKPRDPKVARGWVPLRAQLQRIATQLDRWLPEARVGPGVVRFPGGEIGVGSAKWKARQLAAEGVSYRTLTANVTVGFGGSDEVRVAAQLSEDAPLPATVTIGTRGASLSADGTVWGQPATLRATFAPTGWLPSEAAMGARNWRVPGDKIKLGELYAAIEGSAEIEWRADHLSADVTARGEPVPTKAAPPLEVTLRGKGDVTAFTIESLHAVLPGIVARLTEPVTVERSGRIRESAAQFSFQADLARLPWFSAEGSVTGGARLVSGLAATPVAEFTLAARKVGARDVSLAAVDTRGRLEWPRIHVTDTAIVGANGERLNARGGYDFRTKEVLDVSIEGEIRHQSIARWLPKQPEFAAVKIAATVAGPLAAVKHTGRASVDGLKLPRINPLAVKATWTGAGSVIDQFEVEAAVRSSRFTAAGRADAGSLQLTALELVQGNDSRLRLASPATLRWKPQLQLEMVHLAGPMGSIKASGTAGAVGQVEVSAREVSSRWFGDFLETPGPAMQLTLLALVGTWDRGPMKFSLTAGAALEIGEGRTAAVMAAARGDKDGIAVEALRATESDATVVNAIGRVPITFTPGSGPVMKIDTKGALLVDATVAPNSAFWQKLATVSGVELIDPQASAHLAGTWERPVGKASLKAARIAIDPKRVTRPLPLIEALNVELTGDRTGVTLGTFVVSVEGQAVRAQGKLPVPDGNWAQLIKEPLAAARRGADLRIEIPDAEVAVFTRFLPAVLAPKGRLQADVQYKNGGFEGFLKLRDAASKPLGPLGVLQEISADIALSGRKLALRGVTARSGGQPVTLNGTVEFPEKGTPRFDLALRGENLPFVRQTGLLLRGDLDLKLQTPGEGPPRLSGNVKLRDSLFLADVRAFLPKGGGTSPTRRPPYFAIETPPVNTWALAVEVSGDEFLRMRTPVFIGVASAHFRLGGTLGEPRAIGEVTIDEGRVRMPFASFEVTQGSVRLTESDPFEPAIYLHATGRRYGYDLTMDIDGDAAKPNVVFTSSPALDSEQVLLMVMTGAAPKNEITNSATQRMASIGYFLGSSLLGSLGADAGDPDRLSFGSGEKISRQGEETYNLEYKLTDRWTLTGGYNEFDEKHFGVKWRVFRGKSGEEKGKEKAAEHAKK